MCLCACVFEQPKLKSWSLHPWLSSRCSDCRCFAMLNRQQPSKVWYGISAGTTPLCPDLLCFGDHRDPLKDELRIASLTAQGLTMLRKPPRSLQGQGQEQAVSWRDQQNSTNKDTNRMLNPECLTERFAAHYGRLNLQLASAEIFVCKQDSWLSLSVLGLVAFLFAAKYATLSLRVKRVKRMKWKWAELNDLNAFRTLWGSWKKGSVQAP